jgi:fructose-1,6-bisphosphatase I
MVEEAMTSEPGKTKFQIDLRQHLRSQNISDNMVHLICEIAEASKYVINAIRWTAHHWWM